jgi:signal transduction histidine kinase
MDKKALNSVKDIRRRLIFVVLRALIIVVLLMLTGLLVTTTYEINNKANQNPFYRSPSSMLLQAYYVGHGSWDGVDQLVVDVENPDNGFTMQDWRDSVVIDGSGIVLIDHGQVEGGLVGQKYTIPEGVPIEQIIVNDQIVGGIIKDMQQMSHPLKLTFAVINPIAQISIGVGAFAIVLGFFLIRRVVNPIAEVISAAEKVTNGDLSTRIAAKKGNDDLSALINHFNDMTASLECNDKERRQMLADIAHELRTPLSVLRGRLEGIVDGIYPINDVSIAPALEETYLLERLVEDLRLLTLAETRKLHFELREVDLTDLVDRAVNVFTPQAAEKRIGFTLDVAPDLPSVWADSQRVEQVIGNIIDNALNYSNPDTQISIKAAPEKNSVRVAITDNGNGLPEEEVGKIFDRFYRSEKSRTRTSGGAGLGLAIVKQLVEAQGGSVGAENNPAGGLSVWFSLPQKAG